MEWWCDHSPSFEYFVPCQMLSCSFAVSPCSGHHLHTTVAVFAATADLSIPHNLYRKGARRVYVRITPPSYIALQLFATWRGRPVSFYYLKLFPLYEYTVLSLPLSDEGCSAVVTKPVTHSRPVSVHTFSILLVDTAKWNFKVVWDVYV